GGEEADALAAAGCRFEVVPGVSSALAAPACAGIPVTDRRHNSCLTIFTGHEDPVKGGTPPDYRALAAMPGTLVMLMGVERLENHCEELQAAGLAAETPAALIEWGTTPRQRTVEGTLADLPARARAANFRAPCVAVFGSVVGLRNRLAWFETAPLFGKRVAVTRARSQAGELVRRLRELGADAFEMPTIRIEPAPDAKALREAAADAHTYDWIVFTSPNGVDAFFNAFFQVYQDAREIGGARIAAIGPATAARVRARCLTVDLQPEKFVAEAVLEALVAQGSIENLKFLLPRAEGARELLAEGLEKAGAIVDEVAAYRTVAESAETCGGIRRFREEGADVITFTSSSTASNFAALGLPWPVGLRSASIGPVTSATLRQLGLPVDIEARSHDIPGLVEAVRGLFA
ncbi:MAG: uroporphyrinogen-III synthase, partial [Terrimicrobiaceae bacterium]|nr:uroporphyrinogen-III synthase [Terrimicrobiaceae bacterium]